VKKVGLLYLGLHNQLTKKYGVEVIVSRKVFFTKLGKHFIMPKNLRYLVLKEMEDARLVEKVDRDNIKILKTDLDIEQGVNQLQKIAGMF
jgi:hypothetical protein